MNINISKADARRMVPRLFSGVPNNQTRANGHKPKYKKFHLNVRNNFFTLRFSELLLSKGKF